MTFLLSHSCASTLSIAIIVIIIATVFCKPFLRPDRSLSSLSLSSSTLLSSSTPLSYNYCIYSSSESGSLGSLYESADDSSSLSESANDSSSLIPVLSLMVSVSTATASAFPFLSLNYRPSLRYFYSFANPCTSPTVFSGIFVTFILLL